MDTPQRHRRFSGTVVSDKMDKTIVVVVTTSRWHPKYRKQYVTSKRFKVHDEKNEHTVGQVVTFEECRPLSRDKRWRVIPNA
ncbi:MAG: 30S ribosomal protein S17 [Patescibacteria group bacterium]